MNDVLSDVLTVDVSAGDVSAGDFLPVPSAAPDMSGEALEWYSPAADGEAAEVSVSGDGLALLQDLSNKATVMLSLLVVLCFFAGLAAGISLIKCFFIWRG